MSGRLRTAAAVSALVVAALLATDVWPGVRGPENWQWGRRVFLSPWLIASVAVFAASVGVALRCARAWAGAGSRSLARIAWTAAAVALVFLQMVVLTAAEPEGLPRVRERVESPSFTSYDTVARGVEDPREFLRRYPRIQDTFPVHGPSQPPGRVLYFWGMRQLLGDGAPPVAGFLLMGIGALALVPLIALVGGRCAPGAVGAAVLLMSALPGYLLFTPQTDHLILLLVLTAVALKHGALEYSGRAFAPLLAFAGGVSAGLAVFVSFTSLAALAAWGLALAGGMVLDARSGRRAPGLRPVAATGAAALLGFLAVIAAAAALGLDWMAVFRKCVEAAYRVQVLVHGRDYSTWVVWNLWDFALFLGVPLALVAFAAVPGEWRRGAAARMPFASALLVGVLALDLSGRILGETGRIWMFLMPLAVAAVAVRAGGAVPRDAAAVRSPASAPRSEPEHAVLRVLPLAAAQFLCVLALRAFLNVPG